MSEMVQNIEDRLSPDDSYKPCRKKICPWGFRPGPTQIGLRGHSGSVLERQTPERGVQGSNPTTAV